MKNQHVDEVVNFFFFDMLIGHSYCAKLELGVVVFDGKL